MKTINRRGFLLGLAVGIVAPVIVRPASLMPIKPIVWPYRILVTGWDAYGDSVDDVFEISLDEFRFLVGKIRRKLALAYDIVQGDGSALVLRLGEEPT